MEKLESNKSLEIMACSDKKQSWVIPFGGNAFITEGSSESREIINPCGISNWVSPTTKISLYFHMQYPGKLLVALRLSVPNGSSRISFNLSHNYENNSELRQENGVIDINGSEFQLANCGIFTIPVAGYVDDPADFYFGRRDPSVHLNYALPEGAPDTEYFYNEIYVPRNQDVVGAYFCAMGFTGGSFGIQVNSEQERRVLFSIWSDYNTDNPDEIPEEYKVKLIRKGEDVYVGEFRNEGSGAQSYWRHMWQPETTYKFIVLARPIDSEGTMYTAWFNNSDPSSDWKLIASFNKPKVSTYFKSPYSFSENFDTEMGHVERHCLFSNQWAYDSQGTWREIMQARFTADATAAKQTRMDISGGVGIDGDRRKFFLKNCGFFSERVEPSTIFTRESSGELPPVDVSTLP